MSLEGLSPEDIDAREKQLYALVPEFGNISNKTLREKLGGSWTENLYWAIRNRLIERGILEAGRGYGGIVKRVSIVKAEEAVDTFGVSGRNVTVEEKVSEIDFSKEHELYNPIASVLRTHWSKEQGFDNYLVEVTAKQGSRSTGGKWSRPDMTAVGYKTFPYVPGRFLEVITFEVKPTSTTDVAAVYEALAHRRAATRAYVITHMPADKRSLYDSVINAVCEEAKKFGVGVIVAEDPANFDAWDLMLDAERFEPDPDKLNEFIAQQTSDQLKEQIVRWFK